MPAMTMRFNPPFCQLDFGDLDSGIVNHISNFGFGQIPSCARAHFRKTIPFIHSKLPDADFNIETTIVLSRDSPLRQLCLEHVNVSVLTALNLRYQASSCFRKVAHAAPHEAFPPLVLLVVGASRSFPSSDANENADIPARPFIHGGFFQYLRARVILPAPSS